jgi:hypothetical protein
MSKRIDDVGSQVRDLDTKFDAHVTAVNAEFASLKKGINCELGEIKTALTKLTVADEAVKTHQEQAGRRRELRYAFVSSLALLVSVAVAVVTAVH